MQNFYRNSLICLLLLLFPVTGTAMSRIKDADVVITMKNGTPCFSYPQDEEIRKRPYSFAYLSVSENGPHGGGGWAMQIASSDRKGLLDPNSPETCIQYGVLNPGTKHYHEPAEPLQLNTPYYVHINASARDHGFYERKFHTDFCLVRNEKGEKALVGAEYDGDADAWKCLKPGESPKRGFWQRLFGK
ncbi:MAG TPA: hypothetical protein PLA72_09680 [Smithellaceae bacterium]|nr:hypothetical protein [Smithellaceae bacterium]